MQIPKDLNEYLRARSSELADRILRAFPPLHGVDDPASPLIEHLLRKPFPCTSSRNDGSRQALERSARCGGNRRVRHWKDFDFAWIRSRT